MDKYDKLARDFAEGVRDDLEEALGIAYQQGIDFCLAVIDQLVTSMEKHVAETPGHEPMKLYTIALDDACRMIQKYNPKKKDIINEQASRKS